MEQLGINIEQPGNVVWREASKHRKFSKAMTAEWDKFMNTYKSPSKSQICKHRPQFGIKKIELKFGSLQYFSYLCSCKSISYER